MDEYIIQLVLKEDVQQIIKLLERDAVETRVKLIGAAYAASIKHEEILSVFINNGLCCVNDILMTAIKKSFTESIDILHKYGADINYGDIFGNNTLLIAIDNHRIECIKKLISLQADVNMINTNGDTILTHVARKPGNYSEELQLLVSNGAIVNLVNNYGESPIHVAVTYNNIETLNKLITLSADVNSTNSLGETPLMIASAKNSSPCIELLLSSGANPNMQRKSGETALIIYLQHTRPTQCTEILNLLCKITDLNLCDIKGETVLFSAIYCNSLDIVKKLFSNGVYVDIKNSYGITPFLLAIGQGDEKIAQYLIEMKCTISRMIIDPQLYNYPPLIHILIMQLDTTTNVNNCEKLNQLFFGAGEIVNIETITHPHYIAQEAMDTKSISLKSLVRQRIRNYLLSISNVNLIHKINNLPLPTILKNYLYFW